MCTADDCGISRLSSSLFYAPLLPKPSITSCLPPGVGGWGGRLRSSRSLALTSSETFTCEYELTWTWNRRRFPNLHLINTRGVAPEDIKPCIECWCEDRGVRKASGKESGSVFCCKKCPSSAPNVTIGYRLEINIVYRWVMSQWSMLPWGMS